MFVHVGCATYLFQWLIAPHDFSLETSIVQACSLYIEYVFRWTETATLNLDAKRTRHNVVKNTCSGAPSQKDIKRDRQNTLISAQACCLSHYSGVCLPMSSVLVCGSQHYVPERQGSHLKMTHLHCSWSKMLSSNVQHSGFHPLQNR